MKIQKIKTHTQHLKAFTLVELMVVIAIIGIVTAFLLVIMTNDRDKRYVRAEAEKFVSAMREVQNKALTGDQFGQFRPCSFALHTSAGGYSIKTTAYDPAVPGEGCGGGKTSSVKDISAHTFERGVVRTSGPGTVAFDVPFGNVTAGFASVSTDPSVEFIFEKNAAHKYKVCLYRSGRIEALGFTVAACT